MDRQIRRIVAATATAPGDRGADAGVTGAAFLKPSRRELKDKTPPARVKLSVKTPSEEVPSADVAEPVISTLIVLIRDFLRVGARAFAAYYDGHRSAQLPQAQTVPISPALARSS